MVIFKNPNTLIRHNPDTNHLLADLYKYLEKNVSCTYMFYTYEDFENNITIYFSSKPEWQEICIKEQLINKCPVFDHAFKILKTRNQYLIPWDFVPLESNEARDVVLLRQSYNLAHGLGYCTNYKNIRESIGFAGDNKDISFHLKICSATLIKQTLNLVRTIINPEKNPYTTRKTLLKHYKELIRF